MAEKDSEIKEHTYVIPGNHVSNAVNRFIYLFNWLYGERESLKNPTYSLQTAVDDVNSFLGISFISSLPLSLALSLLASFPLSILLLPSLNLSLTLSVQTACLPSPLIPPLLLFDLP